MGIPVLVRRHLYIETNPIKLLIVPKGAFGFHIDQSVFTFTLTINHYPCGVVCIHGGPTNCIAAVSHLRQWGQHSSFFCSGAYVRNCITVCSDTSPRTQWTIGTFIPWRQLIGNLAYSDTLIYLSYTFKPLPHETLDVRLETHLVLANRFEQRRIYFRQVKIMTYNIQRGFDWIN